MLEKTKEGKDTKIKVEDRLPSLRSSLSYCLDSGEIHALKDGKKVRRLLPNAEGMIITSIDGYILKIKQVKLVWFLCNNSVPNSDQVIFFRDLDETNARIENLLLVQKKEAAVLAEAIRNLSGSLRLTVHNSDAYSYVLEYRDKSKIKREVIADLDAARKQLQRKKLFFTKIVTKYMKTI